MLQAVHTHKADLERLIAAATADTTPAQSRTTRLLARSAKWNVRHGLPPPTIASEGAHQSGTNPALVFLHGVRRYDFNGQPNFSTGILKDGNTWLVMGSRASIRLAWVRRPDEPNSEQAPLPHQEI